MRLFKLIFLLIICLCLFSGRLALAKSTDDLELLFRNFDTINNGNWYKDVDNEDGMLAWQESYVMRAYLEMYQATGNTLYLDKFVNHAGSVLKQRDCERGIKDYQGRKLPAWSAGGKYTNNKTRKAFEVHTGIISYPFAQFASIVRKNPALEKYKPKAQVYLQAAKDAVAIYDNRWTETPTEMYFNAPHNMYLALGSVYLEIYQASGDLSYRKKAEKIARHFKKSLKLETSSDSYNWYYMDGGKYGSEDISHGALDIQFVFLAYQNEIIFNETDMRRFGNTIEKKIIRSKGIVAYKVDGTDPRKNKENYLGLWLPYCQWAPSMFKTCHTMTASKTTGGSVDLLSAALLKKVYVQSKGTTSLPPKVDSADSRYHIVVSGDTLSHIAFLYYGRADQWIKIFHANQSLLSDPNKISPGMKLFIPRQ